MSHREEKAIAKAQGRALSGMLADQQGGRVGRKRLRMGKIRSR